MLKSELKWLVPILGILGTITGLHLRHWGRRGAIPAVTTALIECEERTEESWQCQGNPISLLPKFGQGTMSASSLKSPLKTHANIGVFPSDTYSVGIPYHLVCRAEIFGS